MRWGTFVPNLALGICVLELFATDGQTERRTYGRTKATLIAPAKC